MGCFESNRTGLQVTNAGPYFLRRHMRQTVSQNIAGTRCFFNLLMRLITDTQAGRINSGLL